MISINFKLNRDFDPDTSVVTREDGLKEYRLWGISLWKKNYYSNTKTVKSNIKKESGIGFKAKK